MFPIFATSGATQLATTDTSATAQNSDEELLRMANENPIVMEGKAFHELDELYTVAKNDPKNLLGILKPQEFETKLRFEIKYGSKEFENSWSADERMEYAMAETDGERALLQQRKWDRFVDEKYIDYMRGKAADWNNATRRWNTAATIGKAAGVVAIAGVGVIGGAAAAPVIAGAGQAVNTATLSLGARAATIGMAKPVLATTAVIGGSIAYGVLAPPGAPDIPGGGDDLGRSVRASASRIDVPSTPKDPDQYVVAFGRADGDYMHAAEDTTGLTALNIQDRYNIPNGNGRPFPHSFEAEGMFATGTDGRLHPMFSGYMTQEALQGGAAKTVHFDMRGVDLTPQLPASRLPDGTPSLGDLPGFSKADFHSSSEARQCVAHVASTGPGERKVDIFLKHDQGVTLITPGSNVARGAPLPPDLAEKMPNITWKP
jgi:hypothetical protein